MGDDGCRASTIMVQVNHTYPDLNITIVSLPFIPRLLHLGESSHVFRIIKRITHPVSYFTGT
jgi:hypothetical protein